MLNMGSLDMQKGILSRSYIVKKLDKANFTLSDGYVSLAQKRTMMPFVIEKVTS